MNVSVERSTLVQTERLFMGALGPMVHEAMLAELKGEHLNVLDLPNITNTAKMPRKKVPVDELSAVGRICRSRAVLELERRFCGNTSEVAQGTAVCFSEREKVAAVLDPRTVNAVKAEDAKEFTELLRKAYLAFASRALELEQPPTPQATARKRKRGANDVSGRVALTTAWDDSESEDESEDETQAGRGSAGSQPQGPGAEKRSAQSLSDEFDGAFRQYRKACLKLDWREFAPELPENRLLTPLDLLEADVMRVIKKLKEADADGSKYGLLPLMATHSIGSMGSLLASSFAERINSAANIVLTKGNSVLNREEIDMCTTLRMNREFMRYMRAHHGAELSKQRFNVTVVPEGDGDKGPALLDEDDCIELF
ncbi:hypothetical protein RI054_04g21470 [Pseudoscourfieldia marina]